MKQAILLFFSMVIISCGNTKIAASNVVNSNICKIVPMPSEEVQRQYLCFIKDSDFLKKEFENFNKISKGVLLYHWTEDIGSNQFLIVDFDKEFEFLIKSEGFTKKKDFVLEDKKKLSFILEILQKGSYCQSCESIDGHSNLYTLFVRCNGETKVQYFSPFKHPYGIETSDVTISSIQEIFKIVETNYYKSIKIIKS